MSIHKYGQSISYFYENAMNCLDEEDYVTGLDYLYRALRITGDTKMHGLMFRIQIAEAYCEMGLHKESIREFLKLMRLPTRMEDEVYLGLMKNYLITDRINLAAHYYTQGIEAGILDPYEGFAPLELEPGEQPRPPLRVVKNNDSEHLINFSRQLLGSGETIYARQLLEAIPDTSTQYGDACNMLACLYFDEGDYDKALALADAALAAEPSGINALITKITLLDAMGHQKSRDEVVALLKQAPTEWFDLARIAHCMARIGDDALTVEYCERALEYMPYERDLNLLCALALYNLGEVQKAKDMLVDIQIVFPKDTTLSYYAQLVWQQKGARPIELRPELPVDYQKELTAELMAWLESSKSLSEAEKELAENESLRDKIRYAATEGTLPLMVQTVNLLVGLPSWQTYLRDLLVDPEYPLPVKKHLLSLMLKHCPEKKFELVVNDVMLRFFPKAPKVDCRKMFMNAYWQVYATLAFIEKEFDSKLNTAFRKVASQLKGMRITDEALVAALLAHKSRATPLFTKKDDVCEIFGCDSKAFEEIWALLKQKEKPATKKRAGERI